MSIRLLSLCASGILLLSGCSSKQYFEPEVTYEAEGVQSRYEGKIVDLSRNGATLEDGRYIGKKGISSVRLGEGYRFLSESGRFILASNIDGKLKIIDKKRGKAYKTIELGLPVVSANIKNGLIAYVLSSNTFGLYRIKDGKKLIENRSEQTFAIDTRAASPMFVDSLVVMPMLDGKLVIFDTHDPENASVIYLSSDRAFNNVIYLGRTGDTLVAATPKKLLTLGSEGEFEYKANIAEVVVSKGKVYLLTKEGRIVKFDMKLNELAHKKFKFAQYSAATVLNGKVYALEKQGSLIVLNDKLTKYKIYEVGEVDSPVFISGSKLYKDGEIIHLDRLGYE